MLDDAPHFSQATPVHDVLRYQKTIVFPSATQAVHTVADPEIFKHSEILLSYGPDKKTVCKRGVLAKPLYVVKPINYENFFIDEKRKDLEWIVLFQGIREVTIVQDEDYHVTSYTEVNLDSEPIDGVQLKELLQNILKVQNELHIATFAENENVESDPASFVQRVAMCLYAQRLVPLKEIYSYLEADSWSARVSMLLKVMPSAYSTASSIAARRQASGAGTGTGGGAGGQETTASLRKSYEDKINALTLADEYKAELLKIVSHLVSQDSTSVAATREYLDTVIEYPWGKIESPEYDIAELSKYLNERVYGMEVAKKKILQYLAVQQYSVGKVKSPVICLVGAPGIGKTSFAKLVAKALKRPFASLALGGMNDVDMLRGQRRGWIGASPGLLTKAISRAKAINPVIILDEIDKIGSGPHEGSVKSALLEILDPNQNAEFRDYYMEIPTDLSKVLFIATANYYQEIPYVLANRMDIVFLEPYTDRDKLVIAKEYEWPALLEEHSIAAAHFTITDDVWASLLKLFEHDAGLRNISRTLREFIQKGIVKMLAEKIDHITITKDNLKEYTDLDLDRELANYSMIDIHAEKIGSAVYLAAVVGDFTGGLADLVNAECLPGKGDFQTIGNFGAMKVESLKGAYTYVRTIASRLGISAQKIKESDIVVQFPITAEKSDGPSSGAAIALAIISALTGQPIRQNIAITGALDLKGNIIVIGGLDKKISAAYKLGIKEFVVPAKNKVDYDKLEEDLKAGITIHFASTMEEVLPIYFPSLKLVTESQEAVVEDPEKAS